MLNIPFIRRHVPCSPARVPNGERPY